MMDADAAETRQNRHARRAAGQRGAHRMTPARRTTLGLVGAGTALAVLAGATGIASAEPLFNPLPPSASNPTPGTSNPTPPPLANEGPGAIVDPPSDSGWRPNPWANNAPTYYVPETPSYVEPMYVQPTYIQPTFIGPIELPPPPPMIMPEPGMIRVGSYQEVKPPWITMAEMNSINRWAAYTESRVAQYWLSQGLSPEEADRQAASMMVGGIVGGAAGGAAGFAIGVVPGALVGAGVGALAGLGAGAATATVLGLPLEALFPVGGTPLHGSFIGVGALAGAGIGAVAGAAAGGLLGGALVGAPAAALGVGLGAALGGGDPNAQIDQPWTYRDGEGAITPKENALEFDWDAVNSSIVPDGLALPEEAHINFQVKTDGTLALKLGDERWFGATAEQRDQHFYGEMDKALPGSGSAVKGFLEDENGAFQTGVRGVLDQIATTDPATAQYNPAGDIENTTARETRAPYPTTSTPDPWDEPNREGVAAQNEHNNVGELPVLGAAPTIATVSVAQNVAAPAPMSTPVLPQPIQQVVDSAPAPVKQVVDNAQRALGDLLPGLLGA